MKFIPILFNTEMVQAINKELKTQTRRTNGLDVLNENPDLWNLSHSFVDESGNTLWVFVNKIDGQFVELKCPYGEVGDVLWVRENYLKPPTITNKMLRDGADTWPKFDYQADCSETEIDQYKSWGWTLKPSIHMPKAAARIFLEVTKIRVERLQNISEEDAIAEGIGKDRIGWWLDYTHPDRPGYMIAKNSFRTLWQSINSEESWKANPWVWVVEFKQVQKPINFK